jgi:beta-lactamase class C
MTRLASTRRPGRPDRARIRARETKHTQAVRRTKDRLLAALIVTQAALFAPWTCAAPPATPVVPAAATPAPASVPLPGGRQPLLSPRDQVALAKQVDALAERIVREAKVSGLAVALVQDGEVLLEKGYGVVDTGTKVAVDADTVFRIASLSKAFAATLSAILVEDGALRWDTRVADHLPAFKLRNLQSAQVLTVKDILSHRVGLPHNTHDRLLEADEPYPLLVAKLETVPTICDAGQCYSYQNIAFSLIGDLVFAVTGDFFSHQVEKRLFHPLGMYGATYGRDALEASPRWARPHVRRGGRWLAVRPKETYYRIPPAAGVNASIHDLALWLQAQLGMRPEVIGPDVLTSVQSPLIASPGEKRGSPWRRERITDAYYGLGWRVFDYGGKRLIFHAGAVQGYRAVIGFLPEHGFGIAMVWNCETGVPTGLFPTVLDRYLGLPQRDWLELHRFAPRTQTRRRR